MVWPFKPIGRLWRRHNSFPIHGNIWGVWCVGVDRSFCVLNISRTVMLGERVSHAVSIFETSQPPNTFSCSHIRTEWFTQHGEQTIISLLSEEFSVLRIITLMCHVWPEDGLMLMFLALWLKRLSHHRLQIQQQRSVYTYESDKDRERCLCQDYTGKKWTRLLELPAGQKASIDSSPLVAS